MSLLVARNGAILALIAAIGAAIAVILFIETAHTETNLAKEAFRGTFSSVAASFVTFMTSQLGGLRAVSDAIASHKQLPDQATVSLVRTPGGSNTGRDFLMCTHCLCFGQFCAGCVSLITSGFLQYV